MATIAAMSMTIPDPASARMNAATGATKRRGTYLSECIHVLWSRSLRCCIGVLSPGAGGQPSVRPWDFRSIHAWVTRAAIAASAFFM